MFEKNEIFLCQLSRCQFWNHLILVNFEHQLVILFFLLFDNYKCYHLGPYSKKKPNKFLIKIIITECINVNG